MKKTILAVLISVMAITGILSGCGGDAKTSSDGEKRVTVSVGYPKADDTWKEDEYYRYITDKLNIDIDFRSLSSDSAAEKTRIWISSGDMPDMTYSPHLLMDEYKKYGEQGSVKTIPGEMIEKYPNLSFSLAMTSLLDGLKEAGNGDFYGLVRPLDHYHEKLADFRAAFEEGKDLSKMMLEPEYLDIDGYAFSYRKDWTEKLGIETDYIMEYDDFIDMVLKLKEADLGGVGAENTVGIAVDYTEAPNFFITAFNSSYKYFHKDENGKYVCGLLDESTTDGVLAYADAYRKGVIPPDFYTYRASDLDPLFCTGRAAVIFPQNSGVAFYDKFEKANPGLKAEDCIGTCWVLSPDGKIHGREQTNAFGVYYFSPEISDEKLERLLALADYVSSKEGGPQVRLGVPGKDYKEENGEYINLREKDASGKMPDLSTLYPSYNFFQAFLNPQFKSTGTRTGHAKNEHDNLMAAKTSYPLDLVKTDRERDAYAADDYARFVATYEVNNLFAELITAEGNIEELWAAKRSEIAAAAESVVANMNAALLD